MPNPLMDNSAKDIPVGKGGRAREQTITAAVDKMAGSPGGEAHPAAVAAKPKPSGLVPMGDNGPRIYGSPISEPILSGGK